MHTQHERAQRVQRGLNLIEEYWALHVEMDELKVRLRFLRATGRTSVHPGLDDRRHDPPTAADQRDVLQEVRQITEHLRAISRRLQDVLLEHRRLLPEHDGAAPAGRRGDAPLVLRQLREPGLHEPEADAQPARHPRRRAATQAS
jgi:hypothetical protein